jgi:hypothetical protein
MHELNQSPCEVEGCINPGRYQSKKSPKNLNENINLCLEHIRLHNRNWNYFQDMTEAEIVNFQAKQVYFDQPTWRFGAQDPRKDFHINQKVKEYLGIKTTRPYKNNFQNKLTAQEKEALKHLGLAYPVQKKDNKKAYRDLVKLHHPDKNPSDVTKFMVIKSAYDALMASSNIAE